MKTKDTEAFGR